jgi:hypothetical protein
MRQLRQLSLGIVLTFVLGTYAFAGIVDTPPAPANPVSTTALASATATGIIEPPSGQQNTCASSDSVTNAVLNLIQAVLTAF